MPVLDDTSGPSTWTTQRLIDYGRAFPWTKPALGVVGYSKEPALSFVDDIVKKILAESNPWKFNAAKFPPILTQPYQQDYCTNISQKQMGWLQAGIIVDVNNTSQPIPKLPITVVQNLLPTFICSQPSKACWIPNAIAITGQWPGPNVTYTNPLTSQGGGPSNNPFTSITDPNGNIQVVTQYGVTGSSTPNWPGSGADPGTETADGTVIWTLMDPNGVAIRFDWLATNNSQVWELRAIYQKKPPNITSLQQTVAPIPDDLAYLVKQGFLAYCYKMVDLEKFRAEFAQWVLDVQSAMGSSDREYMEFGFYPAAPIQGGGGSGVGIGTWGYPGWTGWS